MTLRELSQLYWLDREIARDRERLAELRASLECVGAADYDGMPKGSGVSNRLEMCIAEIVDLEAIIQAKMTQCLHERNRLERYIAEIPDSLTRQIFTLRFVNGMSWVQVAHSVGGGNTEGSVKMICYRYLRQTPNSGASALSDNPSALLHKGGFLGER